MTTLRSDAIEGLEELAQPGLRGGEVVEHRDRVRDQGLQFVQQRREVHRVSARRREGERRNAWGAEEGARAGVALEGEE